MSLKAFHIFFIVVSILCCLGFGFWAVLDHLVSGSGVNLALGVVSLAGSGALVWYGCWFLRKLKGVSYL